MGKVKINTQKILYLVTEDWYFCSHRLELAEEAKRQGYDVFVLTREGAFANKIKEKGFTLVPIAIPRSITSPIKDLCAIIKLVSYFNKIKPDLVHNIALKPVLSGSIAAWFARIPVVINSYTGLGYVFISESLSLRVVRSMFIPLIRLFLRTSRIYSIVQNPDDEKILTTYGLIKKDSLSMIKGSGVDTEKFKYTEETCDTPVIVIFPARFLKDKGIYEYINAVRILRETNPTVRFVMAGDTDMGNPTSITKEELLVWINEGVVEWWGHSENMENTLSQVNIVCFPSYREGLPKVLLEAASCGRAIVTTDVPGCREVVTDGVNGLIVPAKNSIKLAEAIEKLIVAPKLRKQMGESGRERVIQNFDIQRINMETTDLYNALVKINK
ncbi:MAG: glycosyltransferase involved in cell wall biosynthesis [Gammaproteobacteria bacterium]